MKVEFGLQCVIFLHSKQHVLLENVTICSYVVGLDQQYPVFTSSATLVLFSNMFMQQVFIKQYVNEVAGFIAVCTSRFSVAIWLYCKSKSAVCNIQFYSAYLCRCSRFYSAVLYMQGVLYTNMYMYWVVRFFKAVCTVSRYIHSAYCGVHLVVWCCYLSLFSCC